MTYPFFAGLPKYPAALARREQRSLEPTAPVAYVRYAFFKYYYFLFIIIILFF